MQTINTIIRTKVTELGRKVTPSEAFEALRPEYNRRKAILDKRVADCKAYPCRECFNQKNEAMKSFLAIDKFMSKLLYTQHEAELASWARDFMRTYNR